MIKILIVEDQSADIMGPYTLMLHLGYEVHLAFDGSEALTVLKQKNFDLVIVDWNMPLVSGYQLLDAIERGEIRSKGHKPLPVIIHSGESLQFEYFNQAHHFQVLDIWKKPFGIPEISKRLRELFPKNRRTA